MREVRVRYFWCHECSFCRQGRLLIATDISSGTLYLHCEECERGWRNPAEASQPQTSFSTLSEEFDMRFPGEAEIDEAGWSSYKLHSFEE